MTLVRQGLVRWYQQGEGALGVLLGWDQGGSSGAILPGTIDRLGESGLIAGVRCLAQPRGELGDGGRFPVQAPDQVIG